jgi:hypothetical protein
LAQDYQGVVPLTGELIQGIEAYKKVQKGWHTSVHPFHVYMQIIDGPSTDSLIMVWKVRGVFSNDFGPIKAHGKQVEVKGIGLYHFNEEGLIKREDTFFDGDYALKMFRGEVEAPQY